MATKRSLRRLSTSSKLVILPYKQGSVSARDLARGLSQEFALKVRRVRPDGLYRTKPRSQVVNYGYSQMPRFNLTGVKTLNRPEAIQRSSNKLAAFRAFQQANVRTVEWTTDRNQAVLWIADGGVAVCRTMLSAHSGRGIILAQTVNQLVNAQLYTKYKKKKKEFRVHVFQGRVIDVSEKRRRNKAARPENFDGYIRNHSNGWVFCRDDIALPADVNALAISAVRALGLDFGAVDIIWNERDNASYVLEVNTAPGLSGQTLTSYIRAISHWSRTP